jgi:hypothetical protein
MNPRRDDAVDAGPPPASLASFRQFGTRHPEMSLWAVALVLAAASTAWLTLQAPNFFRGYDFVRMHAFYKGYFRNAVLDGRLPLWNPFVGLGRPFLADIETETLYPPSLLFVPFGVGMGTALAVLLHQAVAIYGGAKLGQKLGAERGPSVLLGVGLALASPFAARLATGMLPVYFCLCWWPLLLWLGASLQDGGGGRRAAGFAAVVALVVLAGNPPIAFVEMLGLAVFLAGRISLGGTGASRRAQLAHHAELAGAGVLGLGLAAVQLFPFIELLGQGNRPLHDPAFALANGMPPASWLSLLVPASTTFAPNWEYDLYCGLLPLLASVGALFLWRDRNIRGLLALGMVGGLLAAGDRAPFLGWVVRLVPGAGALRFPSRYGICVATAVLGLAALSVSRRSGRAAAAAAGGAAVAAGWILWLRPYVAHEPGTAAPFLVGRLAALLGALLLLVAWHRRPAGPRAGLGLGAALAAFALGDWFLAARLQAPVYSIYGYVTQERAIGAHLRAEGLIRVGEPPPRISGSRLVLPENAGMTEGFATYVSYSNPALARPWGYLHAAAGIAPSRSDFIQLPEAVGARPERLAGLSLVWALDSRLRELDLRRTADPRAYLAFRAETNADWRAASQGAALESASRVARVERDSAPLPPPDVGPATGDCAITSFAPEDVRLHATAGRAAILVLGEAWYPGWRATVNGHPSPVFPVDGWKRGVVVPAGASDVAFRFWPTSLGLGAAISLLSLAVMVGLAGPFARGRARADRRGTP